MKGFRGQMNHRAPARWFKLLHFRVGSRAFVNASLWWGICKNLPLLWLHITFFGKVGRKQRKEAEAELKGCRSWLCHCSRMNFTSHENGTCKRRAGERAGTPGFSSFLCPDFSIFLSLSIPFLPIYKFTIWEPFPPTTSGVISSFPLHWNTKYILGNGFSDEYGVTGNT